MIQISDLHLDRDGQSILHGIDAQIPATGLTAVIGPNGAGKSSLLHVLTGLQPPSRGTIHVDGTDITTARAPERARLITLLPQSTNSLPRLSVADLVTFGRWPYHRGRPGPQDRRIVAETLSLFDLSPLAERRLDSLSGGQRQRAFIAMAHAQSTPWMLLDEPLAALDPKFASDIMRRLQGLSRPSARPRAVVMVLHDLAMAARYADWVLCLKAGKLVRAGPCAETMTGPVLSELFDTRIAVEALKGRQIVMVE
ncbi:MAG: ATP-binding cassette domain-containing protein [Paracoccus sp. (in: a-proteobacteria)]